MNIMPQIRFAIVESSIFAGLGLKQLLQNIMPIAEVDIFVSIDELKQSEASFIHYFVSSRLYFENSTFFRTLARKTIVLVAGDMQIADVRTINVSQKETDIIKTVLQLMDNGHKENTKAPKDVIPPKRKILSPREVEVSVLLSKGLINKEIADQLNIGITTVITHRKNIMEKLNARSLADIIIYTVMNGFVDVEEIS